MMDSVFAWLAGKTAISADYLKLIFAFLIAYPLAALYHHIPSTTLSTRNLKHFYSIMVTAFYTIGLFRMYAGMAQLLVLSVGVWWMCKGGWVEVVGGRKRGDGRMAWAVFVLVMGWLTCVHIARKLSSTPLTTMEISGPMMVLAMKLITFAWNCVDGGVSPGSAKGGDKTANGTAAVQDGPGVVKQLDDVQEAMKVVDVPDLLPFLGYCLFFPSVLIGPAFDYASYDALISGTLYTHPPATTESSAQAARTTGPPKSPRGRHTTAYRKLLTGLAFLGAFAVLEGRFHYERVLDDAFWYAPGFGWKRKLLFVVMTGFVARTKYYGVWTLTEGACIMTGLGFNGYDPKTGRTLWDRVKNLDIVAIETSQSFKVLFDSWNCRTNIWLRETVYKRVPWKGFFNTMMTFGTSAFWHGFAWGYYFAFATGGLITVLGRDVRRLVRPFFLGTSLKPAYDVAGWIVVQISVNYIVAAFMLLGFKDCLKAWHRMGWYGHIMILVPWAVFNFGGRKILKDMHRQAGRDVSSKKGPPKSNAVQKGA